MSNATGDADSFPEIRKVFNKVLAPFGLETHPFQIGWYNELVGDNFTLNYPPTTLAFVVISGPDYFEKCVLPHLKSLFVVDPDVQPNDPLDGATVNAFQLAKKELQQLELETDLFYDFELHPSRKPKVLVQTAAHVAGAAQYFHKRNFSLKIQEDYFSKQSDLAGVAVHPEYGGWFAIRGVLIFKNIQLNEEDKHFVRPRPLNLIHIEEQVIYLLREFAYNWEDEKWRNVYRGSGKEYSQEFKNFLATKPGKRWEFLKENGFLQLP